MGNWRTVQLEGTCGAEDLDALRAAVYYDRDKLENFHCLTAASGICGLGNWPAENINAIGNLAERGYNVEDIEEILGVLSEEAPSLRLTVHVGADYESRECIATIVLDEESIRVLPPQIKELSDLDEGTMMLNIMRQLAEQGR